MIHLAKMGGGGLRFMNMSGNILYMKGNRGPRNRTDFCGTRRRCPTLPTLGIYPNYQIPRIGHLRLCGHNLFELTSRGLHADETTSHSILHHV